MKIKVILSSLAALLLAGAAQAAPQMQTCSPMEVNHNGAQGLSYTLSCQAGDWKLTYKGSVPAGTDPVTINYRLEGATTDGAAFTHTRKARLPSPAYLGQVLVREAVLLDSGVLALRECAEMGCTLYRPMGNSPELAKASVTVTPEVKRLTAENKQLEGSMAERTAALEAATVEIGVLTGKLQTAGTELEAANAKIQGLVAKHAADAEQHAADTRGLEASAAAAQEAAVKMARAEGEALVKEAMAQRDALEVELNRLIAEMGPLAETAQKLKAGLDVESENNKALSDKISRLQDESFALSTKLEASKLAQGLLQEAVTTANTQADSVHAQLVQAEAALAKAARIIEEERAAAKGDSTELGLLKVELEASRASEATAKSTILQMTSAVTEQKNEITGLIKRLEAITAKSNETAQATDAAMKAMTERAAKAETEGKTAQEEIAALKAQLQAANDRASALETAAAQANAQSAKSQTAHESASRELASAAAALAAANSEIADLKSAVAAGAAEKGSVGTELASVTAKASQLEAEVAALKRANGEQAAQLEAERALVEKSKASAMAAEAATGVVQEQFAQMAAKVVELEDAVASAARDKAQAAENVAKSAEEQAEMLSKVRRLEAELEQAKVVVTTIGSKLVAADAASKEAAQVATEAKEKLAGMEKAAQASIHREAELRQAVVEMRDVILELNDKLTEERTKAAASVKIEPPLVDVK